MSLVSLVVPVYNMEQYIKRCMDTLLMQEQIEYEIILVDDGSTDASSIICDKYAEDYYNIVRVIHKENGGLSSARNAGMNVAKGKYIIFPDPDDWVESDYLKRFLELQNKYKTDLVCTGHFVDYDDKCIPVNCGEQLRVMTGQGAQEALLISPCMNGFAWNKLYHMDIIRNHELYFGDDIGTTEDLDFAFRYLKYCRKVCFDPETRTYHYYQRKGAATYSGFSIKKLESIHTYEKIIDVMGETSKLGIAAKEEICNTAINLIPMYLNSDIQDEEILRKIQGYIKKYFGDYQKSGRYDKGRKVQAMLARYMPRLYCKIKNRISKGE